MKEIERYFRIAMIFPTSIIMIVLGMLWLLFPSLIVLGIFSVYQYYVYSNILLF